MIPYLKSIEGFIRANCNDEASHNCVQCEVKHFGSNMKTSKLSGEFINSDKTRKEFYDFIKTTS